MNRRLFLQQSLITVSSLSIALPAFSAPFLFEEGVHYKLLPETARSTEPKGSVQEFFFYGCPHCMDMEPHVEEWLNKNPTNIRFEQIPAVFQNPAWSFLARAYYGLKNSNQFSSPTHLALFELFVKDRAKPKNHQELADLLAKKINPFDQQAFTTATNNETTDKDLTRATHLSGQYQLEAVPSFVINGKYLTDLTMTGTHTKLFALLEQLANQ